MFKKKWKVIGVIVLIVLLTTTLIAAAGAVTGSAGESVSYLNILQGEGEPTEKSYMPWVAYENPEGLAAAELCAEEKLAASSEHIACLVEAEIAADTLEELAPLIAACDATRDEAYEAAEAIAAGAGVECAPDRTKGIYYGSMQRSNISPVAQIEVLDGPLPGRLQLSAQDSSDPDGTIRHYIFRVEDAETGEVIAGPLDSRRPHARLAVSPASPTQTLRAVVTVEDDSNELDTAEALTDGPPPACFTNIFLTCMGGGGSQVVCTINDNINTNDLLFTGDILSAAQQCDSTINEATKFLITAWGGWGGDGGSLWPGVGGTGGNGGGARVGTTIGDLQAAGMDTGGGLCFGLAKGGSHSGDTGGAGGAATLLRNCGAASDSSTAGVIVIAGGAGAGGPGTTLNGEDGGSGGIAISSTAGACPPNCLTGTTGIDDTTNYPQGLGSGSAGVGPAYGGGGGVGATNTASSACHTSGNPSVIDGKDGTGGKGGRSAWGTAGWNNAAALGPFVGGSTGQGGDDGCSAGAGGGGYGGGAAGGGTWHGGGGGGSFAMKSSWDISGFEPPRTNSGSGIIQFDFFPYIP